MTSSHAKRQEALRAAPLAADPARWRTLLGALRTEPRPLDLPDLRLVARPARRGPSRARPGYDLQAEDAARDHVRILEGAPPLDRDLATAALADVPALFGPDGQAAQRPADLVAAAHRPRSAQPHAAPGQGSPSERETMSEILGAGRRVRPLRRHLPGGAVSPLSRLPDAGGHLWAGRPVPPRLLDACATAHGRVAYANEAGRLPEGRGILPQAHHAPERARSRRPLPLTPQEPRDGRGRPPRRLPPRRRCRPDRRDAAPGRPASPASLAPAPRDLHHHDPPLRRPPALEDPLRPAGPRSSPPPRPSPAPHRRRRPQRLPLEAGRGREQEHQRHTTGRQPHPGTTEPTRQFRPALQVAQGRPQRVSGAAEAAATVAAAPPPSGAGSASAARGIGVSTTSRSSQRASGIATRKKPK